MCGICGIYSPHGIIQRSLMQLMCDAIRHRGPDDEGIFVGSEVGLGNRRLSIIDLASGHQPISNEDDSVWITFNGEIYNYPELQDQVLRRGHRLKTRSDTEIILHLYEDYGTDSLQYLRGMFAFAIWDQNKHRLFLARDRVGKKPLVYVRADGDLLFASEIRCLLQDRRVRREPNLEAIHHYLTYQYVPAPWTAFKGIYKLPPAHFLIYERGKFKVERYWDLDYTPRHDQSEAEWISQILELLRESTKIRMMSEVPLGAFLSGGIDSSVVVALMSQMSNHPVKTFSIGFGESNFDETRYARLVARHFHTDHHELIVRPDAMHVLPKLVWHYGEPFGDSSALPTYYVSQMSREHVTVALNGDGGDEVFGGYDRYVAQRVLALYGRFPAAMRVPIAGIANLLPESNHHKNWRGRAKRFTAAASQSTERRYARLLCYFDNESKSHLYSAAFSEQLKGSDSFHLIEEIYAQARAPDLVGRTLYVDVMTYLPNDLLVKVDIASMAVSLEARSPFLDHQLLEFAAHIPSDLKIHGMNTKYILKKAMRGILPEEVLRRTKKGFGVPVGYWFRTELRDWARQILLDSRSIERGYFNPQYVQAMLDEHASGRVDHGPRIWALLNLELWHRTYIDRSDFTQPISP